MFAIGIIVFASLRIHRTLKHRGRAFENYKVKRIHNQVTRILILQVISPSLSVMSNLQVSLPLIIVIVPITAIVACAILQMSVPLIGLYTILSTMWFTSIKPLASILVIERYRKIVFGCQIWSFRHESSTTTVVVEMTSNQRQKI